MKELEELVERIEIEINKTPTGELRNLLCDVNIMIQALTIPGFNIKNDNNNEEVVCPRCQSKSVGIIFADQRVCFSCKFKFIAN